jgi:pilus assembly protein CpaC
VLKALATKNLARMLAEPNLLVKSGRQGRFLAGSKIPIQVVTGVGAISGTTIEYIDVGVKLNFKPVVLENGMISLTIDPAEVSSVSGTLAVNGYPVIDSREIRTEVQLKDGESLVLAGLLQEATIKTMSKIPVLGDIPILGALFRSTQDDLTHKELVFFITPKISIPAPSGVEPVLPTDERLTPEQERDLTWMPLGE